MKEVKFWIDWCLEAGSESVSHRYWVSINLNDEEYEKLYQMWMTNNCSLESWYVSLQDEDEQKLYEKINSCAYSALNELLKKNDPAFADPVDLFWELSEESANEF